MVSALECSAEECIYNKRQCCCKGEILVEGARAEESRDTCCGSFSAKKDNSFRNVCECNNTPSRMIEIGCEAVTCTYNKEKKCFADAIGIAGAGASEARQTQCATFKKE